MRKFFAIICCAGLVVASVAQNKMFVIHHPDKSIDAFLFNEIDSIRYSKIGIDSLEYSEVMTQEIWTPDSVYRYDVSQIDSINFQMPPTIVKSGAIDLVGEIEPYVISSDGATVLFSTSTPDAMLPQVGDCLFAVYPNDKLPYGFLGNVSQVTTGTDGIVVTCTEAELTDAFEQFYGSISTLATPIESPNLRTMNIGGGFDVEMDLPTIEITPVSYKFTHSKDSIDLSKLPFGDKDKLDVSTECELRCQLSVTPHVKLSYLVALQNLVFIYTRTVTSLNADYNLNVAGKVASEFELKRELGKLPAVPMGLGFKFEVPVGVFLSGNVAAGIEYNYSNSFSWYSDVSTQRFILTPTVVVPNGDFIARNTGEGDSSLDASMQGALQIGFYAEPGVAWLDANIAKISGEVHLGAELSSNTLFYTTDLINAQSSTALYQRLLSEGGINFSMFLGAKCLAEFNGNRHQIGEELRLNFIEAQLTNAVPEFKRPQFHDNGDDTASMSYGIDGVCLMPKRVGIVVEEDGGTEPRQVLYNEEKYANQKLSYDTYSLTFNYNPEKRYTIHPIVDISPLYTGILGVPAWPPIDGNVFFPFIYHNGIQSSGIRITSGMPNIESAADNGTSVQEGNFFPFYKTVETGD